VTTHRDLHGGAGDAVGHLAFALLTVSDTRTDADDVSGSLMRQLVTASGHSAAASAIVPDEPTIVRERVLAFALDPACDVILCTGGTGLSARDRTVEAVFDVFDVRIDGFGELFRLLSFETIGSRAMLSRAAAGVVRGKPVFLLPGSPEAVRLALTRLVLPEIAHVVGELRRHGPRG
jgi:molybdenum cofactor biosynthesis protein B